MRASHSASRSLLLRRCNERLLPPESSLAVLDLGRGVQSLGKAECSRNASMFKRRQHTSRFGFCLGEDKVVMEEVWGQAESMSGWSIRATRSRPQRRSKAVLANCVILGSVIGFADRYMLVLVHRKLSERNPSSLSSLGGVCGKQVRDTVQVQHMLLRSYGQRDMAKAATCFPRDATLSGYHGRELVRTVGRLC